MSDECFHAVHVFYSCLNLQKPLNHQMAMAMTDDIWSSTENMLDITNNSSYIIFIKRLV